MIEDHSIITLLKAGDQKGISLMYDKYADALYGVALKIVQDESLAEDVVQEAFTKIWRKRDAYDSSKAKLFTWILNITRNTAIDSYRSRNSITAAKNRLADSSVYNNSSYSLNPDTVGLRSLVEKLDPKYLEVIDLIYFNGYTHKEAQEHLNIPIGTIKTRLRKALQELRLTFNIQIILALLSVSFII